MGNCSNSSVTRRDMLLAGAASALAVTASNAAMAGVLEADARPVASPALVPVSFTVNGDHRSLEVDTRTTLLDALREHLHLTGTKKGCDHGQCGACTVIVDGRRINSCLTLAVDARGRRDHHHRGPGHARQRCIRCRRPSSKHDGYQCGYCTPGQICSAVAVLDEIKAGIPSHVSADLTAPAAADARRRCASA